MCCLSSCKPRATRDSASPSALRRWPPASWTFTLGLGSLVGGPVGGLLARAARRWRHKCSSRPAPSASPPCPANAVSSCCSRSRSVWAPDSPYVALANLITDAVPDEHAATGTALIAVANQLGAATGASALAWVRTLYPVGSGDSLFACTGYRLAFVLAAGVALLALLTTLRMRHGRTPATGGAVTAHRNDLLRDPLHGERTRQGDTDMTTQTEPPGQSAAARTARALRPTLLTREFRPAGLGKPYEHFDLVPRSRLIGAEVRGIDLAEGPTTEEIDELKRAIGVEGALLSRPAAGCPSAGRPGPELGRTGGPPLPAQVRDPRCGPARA